MKKEIRVYGIDLNVLADNSDERDVNDIPNNEFIDEAEKQGLIWTLAGFSETLNGEMLPYDVWIRFIIVETSELPKNIPINYEQDMRDFIYN